MLLPVVAWFFVFKYMPMYGVVLAFKEFMYNKGILWSPWVGFANFNKAFNSSIFWEVFVNTIQISLGRLIFVFPVPILISILLNEIRHRKFKRVVQTVVYMPHFLSWVIIAGIIFNLLSVDGGFINKLIIGSGREAVNFLTTPEYFRPLLYISHVWKEMGWETIICLATLASINPEIYEAAIVDGANRFQRFLHVTWPGLKGAVVIMFILSTGSIMNAGFDQIYNLYNPAVYSAGDIIDTYVFRETLLSGQYGFGTAVGLFKSVINVALLLMVNRLASMLGEQGIY